MRNRSRDVPPDDEYWLRTRRYGRGTTHQDVAPDDVALFGRGRPARASSPRAEKDLAAYGYYGQGYSVYGRARPPGVERALEESELSHAGSAAYAFGYTTSLRSPAGAGHAGKGPKDSPRSDARILEDVCDRLSDDDEIDASEISVSVKDGEVWLEGRVTDRYVKRRAEDVALSVRGALDVHNRLEAKKGLLRELGEELIGKDGEHHGHHGSGTGTAPNPPR
jgi:osmotically-inducible protein OsmY